MATNLGLLPDGALETLNEAAFEAVGEPVCEGSDPIDINSYAVEGDAAMTEPAPVTPLRLRPRDRDAIISSLRAGVVPRRGFAHIQVGRADEVTAIGRDLDRVADGGSMVRFVIGDYGAGKTFFLNLAASIAAEKKLVTAAADLTPDRRLHATGGQSRGLYAELMRNLATRSTPDGGALPGVVDRFVTTAQSDARSHGVSVGSVIAGRLQDLSQMVGGYDFAQVIGQYWTGYDSGNDQLMADAIRWLRGEFTTKTDARNALGVRTIIDDSSVYDTLKLMARFVRLAGFAGLIVCFDEMVNLYKLANTVARNGNYEQVLRIVNDCLQGQAAGLGVLFSGTPELLMDTRRGLYSYDALRSRLAENSFAVRRPRRLHRAGAAAREPRARGHVRPAGQAAARLRRRRRRALPGARRGADCLHGPLRAPHR